MILSSKLMLCSFLLQVSEDTWAHLVGRAHLWPNTRGKLSNITLKVDIEIRCTWPSEALGSAAATSLLLMHFNHPTLLSLYPPSASSSSSSSLPSTAYCWLQCGMFLLRRRLSYALTWMPWVLSTVGRNSCQSIFISLQQNLMFGLDWSFFYLVSIAVPREGTSQKTWLCREKVRYILSHSTTVLDLWVHKRPAALL